MNIKDYVIWRGDLSFEMVPFNHLDALLFSQLSMLRLDDVLVKNGKQVSLTIAEAAKMLKNNIEEDYDLGLIIPKDIISTFYLMAESNRYKDLKLDNYVNNVNKIEETQFSALTIDLDSSTRVVSFSGTDDTLVGWKENFNMLFVAETSGQAASCEYLEEVSKWWRHIYICGHSKGANLAIYSLLHSVKSVQKKTIEAIVFDGPGLIEDVTKLDHFDKVISKAVSYIPDTSIIGVLFDHYEKMKVVKSIEKGLYQHDVFSWEVLGQDFVYAKGRSAESIHIEQKIKSMINDIDQETRIKLVNEGYKILSSPETDTLTKLYSDKIRIIKDYLGTDTKVQKQYRKIFMEILKDKVMRDAIYESAKEFIRKQRINKKSKNE